VQFLREHPFCECEECKGVDLTQIADTVDHVIPHKGDQALFWDRSNWAAMSANHHSRKTALLDGGWGRPRSSQPMVVRGCDAEGNPLGSEHGWNR